MVVHVFVTVIHLLRELEELKDEIGEVQGSVEVRGGTHPRPWRLPTLILTAVHPDNQGTAHRLS